MVVRYMEEDLVKRLTDFGLSINQAKVYLRIVQSASTSVNTILKTTQSPSPQQKRRHNTPVNKIKHCNTATNLPFLKKTLNYRQNATGSRPARGSFFNKSVFYGVMVM
jgi:hypothetical protein